jgi:hypothetical protein
MPSNLAMLKSELESELGDTLGFGMGELGGDPKWNDRDAIRIRRAAKSGLRAFYFCGHVWSFMRLQKALTLVEGATVLRLPEDFGGFAGDARVLIAQASDGLGVRTLDLEGIGTVNMALQLNIDLTGLPGRVAQRPEKTTQAGQMQRDELVFAPIADQDYTVTVTYQVTPDYAVNDLTPYVYGGVEHHETVMALCRAAAEVNNDDRIGPQSAVAQQALQRSIKLDRLKQPQRLGYNRDLSDNIGQSQWFDRQWPSPSGGVLYNGVLFDE